MFSWVFVVGLQYEPFLIVLNVCTLDRLVSAVLAHFILKEKLHKLGMLGCVMCIVGSVIIVIHAPQESPITSVQEIWIMATQPGQSSGLVYVFLYDPGFADNRLQLFVFFSFSALRRLSNHAGIHPGFPFFT